jgi:hypothetical protein
LTRHNWFSPTPIIEESNLYSCLLIARLVINVHLYHFFGWKPSLGAELNKQTHHGSGEGFE